MRAKMGFGEDMYDCSKDVRAHHDQQVTLPDAERRAMSKRRNSNRDRLNNGLAKATRPLPTEFVSQGSYEMRTMIQHPAKDYDIDDGAYFDAAVLVGPRGGTMSALEARQMVRDALDDKTFKTPPSCRKNCVRVDYDAGYHVDIPVYRATTTTDWSGRETTTYELASSSWIVSDARDVTKWFNAEMLRLSPADDTHQLRRIVRAIKKFARSRDSWSSQILSGFGITKLVTQCFHGDAREDLALYNTMQAIRDRLNLNMQVDHPCTPNTSITSGPDDPKPRFLRDRLSEALGWLAPAFEADCDRAKALGCWDKVYYTEFFSARLEITRSQSASVAAVGLTSGMLMEAGAAAAGIGAVNKEGGGRYA